MVLVTFAFYKDTFLGNTIPETEFPTYAKEAFKYVDKFTFGRASLNEGVIEVQEATCKVAELLYTSFKGDTQSLSIVKSETLADWKIEYAVDTNKLSREAVLRNACELYLANTNLISRWG